MAHVRNHTTFPQYRMKVGIMPDFSGSQVIRQEEPFGTKDGTNKVFTLAFEPIKNSEQVFKDGMYMRKGAAHDYTISGKTITFAEAPSSQAQILVDYKTMG